VSATLLPIPSGTWTDEGKPVDVLSMWVDGENVIALTRYPTGGHVISKDVRWLRLTRPDPATTLGGVLEQLDALRDATEWAPPLDPVGRVHREIVRIIEAARAGA
jgi:hypothetical protein